MMIRVGWLIPTLPFSTCSDYYTPGLPALSALSALPACLSARLSFQVRSCAVWKIRSIKIWDR